LQSVWSTTWTTLREIDVNAIRDESERAFTIACCGDSVLLDTLVDLLDADVYERDDDTADEALYEPPGEDPLIYYPLPLTVSLDDVSRADMLIVTLDGRQPPAPHILNDLEQISTLTLPILFVVLYDEQIPSALDDASFPPSPLSQMITISDPETFDAVELLAAGVFACLPAEYHLAAARNLPGLRSVLARDLITGAAFSNGSYALIASLSEQFPVFHLTVGATDMLVLTKNQILLVYKLALAHGAPSEFQANLREVLAVVGLAYLWRQAARSLIKTLPAVHMAPRVAISYAGTYSVGLIAWNWFAYGKLMSSEQIQQTLHDVIAQGQHLAATLKEQVSTARGSLPQHTRRSFDRPR
jgi:uncharacterized protein (DUF697 family)